MADRVENNTTVTTVNSAGESKSYSRNSVTYSNSSRSSRNTTINRITLSVTSIFSLMLVLAFLNMALSYWEIPGFYSTFLNKVVYTTSYAPYNTYTFYKVDISKYLANFTDITTGQEISLLTALTIPAPEGDVLGFLKAILNALILIVNFLVGIPMSIGATMLRWIFAVFGIDTGWISFAQQTVIPYV